MTPSPHGAVRREELVGIVGWPQPTSELMVEAWRELGIHVGMLSPAVASSLLGPHDVAVGRFDVRATLDGVQPGLQVLVELERRGVRVIAAVSFSLRMQVGVTAVNTAVDLAAVMLLFRTLRPVAALRAAR